MNASYGRMTTLVQTIGAYTAYGGGVGVTRELGKGLHTVLRLDALHNDIASAALFRHTEYRASLGSVSALEIYRWCCGSGRARHLDRGLPG